MIPTINLMSAERLRERLVRRRIRQWCSALALALGVVLPLAGVLHESVDYSLRSRHADAVARNQSGVAHAEGLSARLDDLAHQRRISSLIDRRPRFTLLINAIAGTADAGIALEAISLASIQTDDSTQRTVTIDGLAQNQLEAQQLTVRLENLGVFQSVSLSQSNRRSTEVGDLLAFRAVATLRGGD